MAVASLIIVSLLFGVYGWLCCVECGLAVLRLLPGSTLTRHSLRLLRPVWEVTHLFLLAGLAGAALFFRNDWAAIAGIAIPSLTVGLVLVVIRAVMVIGLTRSRAKTGPRWYNWVFLAVCVALPLSFGAAGVRLLTGHGIWETPAGWLLMAMQSVGLAALALAYVYYVIGQTPRDRLQFVTRWLNILLCLLGTFVLERVSVYHIQNLLTTALFWFMALVSLIIVLQAITRLTRQERYMWWYLSVVVLASPLLLALANRPYLAFPAFRVHEAYVAGPWSSMLLGALGLALPVGMAGSMLLARRLLARR